MCGTCPSRIRKNKEDEGDENDKTQAESHKQSSLYIFVHFDFSGRC